MMKTAIDLNNTGCKVLQRGHYKLSIALFTEAINVIKVSRSSSRNDNVEMQKHFVDVFKNTEQLFQRPLKSDLLVNASFLYASPFKIDPSENPDQVNERYASAVILFNTALASHLRLLEKGMFGTKPRFLLDMYNYAYSLIETNDANHPVIALLVLATLNNMGQIYHQTAQFYHEEQCLREMDCLLSSDRNSIQELKENGCWGDFVLNVAMLRNSVKNAPAA
jgi:hypothetical protein